METLKYWMWLVIALGPGNNRIWELTQQYNTIEDVYNGITSGNYNGMTSKEISSFKQTDLKQAEELIKYCNDNGILMMPYDDENYPASLKDIYNPPALLFYYGDLSFLKDSVTLAVVGARQATDYSIKIGEDICSNLAKVGTVLVSGFAYGIDSVAHKCALKNKSKTIAVLASGIDYNYPEGNAKFKKIIAHYGAVITEYFPGTKPFTAYFKNRNRIISGLSMGVLVVQASCRSGALNTVSHAVSQGKDIFCVTPHDVYDERYTGVINLLRDGAIPVFSHLDIMYEYYDNYSHKLNHVNPYNEYQKKSESSLFEEENKEKFQKENDAEKLKKVKVIKEARKKISHIKDQLGLQEEKKKVTVDESRLDDTQKKIVESLKENDIMSVDELCEKLSVDVSDILVSLTELEIDGIIKAMAGKRYSL